MCTMAPDSSRWKDNGGDCYYDSEAGMGDPLSEFVGVHGLLVLSSWIDVGKWHNPNYDGPHVRDLREWTSLFRRLRIPYYEEARHYTGQFDMGKNGYSETCPLSANPSLGTNPTFQNHSIDIPSKFRDFLSQY